MKQKRRENNKLIRYEMFCKCPQDYSYSLQKQYFYCIVEILHIFKAATFQEFQQCHFFVKL